MIPSANCASADDQESNVSSSDDTVFMDLPLPPIPGSTAAPATVQAVCIRHADGVDGAASTYVLFEGNARLYSRLDDFGRAPHQSPERCSSSVSVGSAAAAGGGGDSADETTPGWRSSSGRWSSSDEDASCYRERMSLFRCSASAEQSERRRRRRCDDEECVRCSNGRLECGGVDTHLGGMFGIVSG